MLWNKQKTCSGEWRIKDSNADKSPLCTIIVFVDMFTSVWSF